MTKRPERGAVTVEFALILPLLLLMVLAIVEFGIRYQRNAEFNNAAFITARTFGVTNDAAKAEAAGRATGLPAGASFSIGSCSGGTVSVTITFTEDSPTGAFGATFDVDGKGSARCET